MDRVRNMLGCNLPEVISYTGKGVYAAILDSGIVVHPDLKNQIVTFKDFTNNQRFVSYKNLNKGFCYDDNGHGTHVAGILSGNGKMSNGKYRGIAPDCRIVCGKVLDSKGGGSLKSLLNGLNWILELSNKLPIRIVNISIEMENDDKDEEDNIRMNEELSDISEQIDRLWNKDMVIIVAAGNKGPKPMSLSPISEFAECVCVGCHDGEYTSSGMQKLCSDYSGRGPSKGKYILLRNSNPLKKPDIVAPGSNIISCNYKYMNKPYVAKSGTSMSAPIVSGACALYLQKNPYATNFEIINAIKRTATDVGEKWSMQGAGMINIKKMLTFNQR